MTRRDKSQFSDPPASAALPCCPADEQALISLLILQPEPTFEACQLAETRPDWFLDHRHRLAYSLLQSLIAAKQRITVDAVLPLFHKEHIGNAADYYQHGLNSDPFPLTAADFLPRLKEFQQRRQVVEAARRAIALATDTAQLSERILPDFEAAVRALSPQRAVEELMATPIGDLVRPSPDDPTELIRHRYLCQRGSLLIPGPTGVGKSSFLLQALACWANGLPHFGLGPPRPLSSVLIQAENDDGDMAEMRDGICTGLNFTSDQRKNFFSRVRVFASNGITGRAFCTQVVDNLLAAYKPDLLSIDPALSFLGGDTKEQRDVGNFLRVHLNPVIFAHNVGNVMLHHTNKPAGKDGPWKNGEMSYVGSGSAEWANWARAVLTIQSTGAHGFYKLHAAKRGPRLSWKDADGNATYERTIAHSKDRICWVDSDPSQIPAKPRLPSKFEIPLLQLLARESLSTMDWLKQAQEHIGLSRATFNRIRSDLEHDGKILCSAINHKWTLVTKTPKTRNEKSNPS